MNSEVGDQVIDDLQVDEDDEKKKRPSVEVSEMPRINESDEEDGAGLGQYSYNNDNNNNDNNTTNTNNNNNNNDNNNDNDNDNTNDRNNTYEQPVPVNDNGDNNVVDAISGTDQFDQLFSSQVPEERIESGTGTFSFFFFFRKNLFPFFFFSPKKKKHIKKKKNKNKKRAHAHVIKHKMTIVEDRPEPKEDNIQDPFRELEKSIEERVNSEATKEKKTDAALSSDEENNNEKKDVQHTKNISVGNVGKLFGGENTYHPVGDDDKSSTESDMRPMLQSNQANGDNLAGTNTAQLPVNDDKFNSNNSNNNNNNNNNVNNNNNNNNNNNSAVNSNNNNDDFRNTANSHQKFPPDFEAQMAAKLSLQEANFLDQIAKLHEENEAMYEKLKFKDEKIENLEKQLEHGKLRETELKRENHKFRDDIAQCQRDWDRVIEIFHIVVDELQTIENQTSLSSNGFGRRVSYGGVGELFPSQFYSSNSKHAARNDGEWFDKNDEWKPKL
ncbi:hypothetical protein RFI_29571, partial [Reticulomyxa filosa]